jgi:hypothetical protein
MKTNLSNLLFYLFLILLTGCTSNHKEHENLSKNDTTKTDTTINQETITNPISNETPEAESHDSEILFLVKSNLTESEPYTDENPVGYAYYRNSILILINGKKNLLEQYNCTLHGAGDCGSVPPSDFSNTQLKIPNEFKGRNLIDDVIVGQEIERMWSRYNRYLAILEENQLLVYKYLLPDENAEVDNATIELLKTINLDRY